MEFVLGGAAGVCAGIFTNPFDVIKTRQQVQGEVQSQTAGITGAGDKSANKKAAKPYRNSWQAMRSIVAAEGVRGMQKGLVPALGFQMIMNGTRMGMFQVVSDLGLTRDPQSGELSPLRCLLWSGTAGLVGAGLGCPLNMVKTRLQIQSASQTIAVGYQHGHRGTLDALVSAFRAGGVRGMWRGFTGIVPRTFVASAIQLTTFQTSKEWLGELEIFRGTHMPVVIAASVVSGWVVVCGMTPFDVVSTRLFNQGLDKNGRGLMYRNLFDCFAKTVRNEGMRGLYKGFMANYWRLVPHTILHLTFWEQFKVWKDIYVTTA